MSQRSHVRCSNDRRERRQRCSGHGILDRFDVLHHRGGGSSSVSPALFLNLITPDLQIPTSQPVTCYTMRKSMALREWNL